MLGGTCLVYWSLFPVFSFSTVLKVPEKNDERGFWGSGGRNGGEE